MLWKLKKFTFVCLSREIAQNHLSAGKLCIIVKHARVSQKRHARVSQKYFLNSIHKLDSTWDNHRSVDFCT